MGNLVKPEGRERDRFVAEVVIAWVLTVFGAFWLCVFDVLLSGEQCSHRTWDVRTTRMGERVTSQAVLVLVLLTCRKLAQYAKIDDFLVSFSVLGHGEYV